METIMNQKDVKARKEHRCNFCAETIRVNEVFKKSTHVYDGTIYDWKTHKHCAKIADRLNMYDDFDEGLTQDDFAEHIHSEHYEILVNVLNEDWKEEYGQICTQLRYVPFRQKLWLVIRHYKKLDNEPTS